MVSLSQTSSGNFLSTSLHRGGSDTEATSTAKATSTTDSLIKLLYRHDFREGDSLHDELCDAVTRLDLKVLVREIGEENTNVAAVVGINDTSESVDAVLSCQSRARSNAAV